MKKTYSSKEDLTKFSARIRFNWGFHDGAADQRIGRQAMHIVMGVAQERHTGEFPNYAAGYEAGRKAVVEGRQTETSTDAWEARS